MKKLMIPLFLILLLTACGDSTETQSVDIFAMDTYMSISATGVDPQEVLSQSQAIIAEIETAISRTNPESDIYALNHSGGQVVQVSDITYDILSTAVLCAQKTGGAFDPTICAITDLWGIGTEGAHIPTQDEIDLARSTVSYENILLLEDNQVQLLNGANLDLGAVGKGYAADQIVTLYDQTAMERGIISLAGNIYVYGEKADGSLWNIGVTDPDSPSQVSITLQTTQASVVTTGGYERYFEEDGVIYHHIFDATTGYPTTEDIKSVTVISESSTLADIYATALFVMGYDDAIAFAQKEGLCVILIGDQNQIYLSDAIADQVTLGAQYET